MFRAGSQAGARDMAAVRTMALAGRRDTARRRSTGGNGIGRDWGGRDGQAQVVEPQRQRVSIHEFPKPFPRQCM